MNEDFEKELEELLGRMNHKQLAKFLTVSSARNIVYGSKSLCRLEKEHQIYYLNFISVSLGLNFCWFFNIFDLARARALDLALDRALDLALVRDFDFARNLARDLALARTRARARTLALALAFDLARARVLVLDRALDLALVRDYKSIMIEDARLVISNDDNFAANSQLTDDYHNKFLEFLDILKNLNGHYWADFFQRAFENNFKIEEKDIKAILSLQENQIYVPVAQCSAYLSDFVLGSTDSNEIRLMILGKKGEGKTSFAKRFQDLNAPMPEKDESTKGIDVHDFIWEPISNNFCNENLTIRIWDFAGHEVTHAAHKFFLSDKCVYVIVCQARQGESIINAKIEYWLEHIKDYAGGNKDSHGNKPKIFVLINEWDEHKPSINESSIEINYQEYELHFEYLNIDKDNEKDGKLAAFKKTILKHISTIDTTIPSSYCLMRKHINEKFEKEQFVNKDEIIKIIQKDKGDSSSDNEIILKNLSDLAFCFWFNKVEGADTVVLNPRWITGAVYKIINWVQKAEPYNNAAIHISEFGKALRNSPEDKALFPSDKDRLLFNIMKHFELAYSEDNETLIIPHCLKDSYPDNEVGLTFDFNNSVQVEISVESKGDAPVPEFPISLIPRFIVKNYHLIHKNKQGNAVTSKNKAMFLSSNGKSYAEIKRNDRDHYRIYITVQEKNKTISIEDNIKYLAALISDFNIILSEHKRFQEQKPEISYRATKINGEPLMLSKDELKKNISAIEEFRGVNLRVEEYKRIPQVNQTFNNCTFIGRDQITNNSPELIEQFIKEMSQAKEQINKLTELQQEDKEKLFKLMNDMQTAMKNNDNSALEKYKSTFYGFIAWAGDTAVNKVLPILANLAAVAPYFPKIDG